MSSSYLSLSRVFTSALAVITLLSYQSTGQDFVQQPKETYDYIVVGAGSAGSVIASRLSEDPDVSVLLLEAGGDDRDIREIMVPALARQLWNNNNVVIFYYTAKTDKYPGLENGQSRWPRGQVLGGSSSANYMAYVRGSKQDYNRWADYTGDQSWNYEHLLSYFKKSQKATNPELGTSLYVGTDGPLGVTRSCAAYPLTDKVIQTFMDLGYNYTEDYNGETMEGVSRTQSTIEHGERVSCARAFIHPVLAGRPNLNVAINARVHKVIIRNKRAEGVEVKIGNTVFRVNASKEVILSAGAIGSPQLLMLSGVGPKQHLEKMNIPVIADMPVGNNLQDHLFFDVVVSINQSLAAPSSVFSSTWASEAYDELRQGPLAIPGAGITFFTSTTEAAKDAQWPDLKIQFILASTTSSAMTASNYKASLVQELSSRDNVKFGWSCYPTLLRPESTGTIRLSSTDPTDPPVIEPNYFDNQEDVGVLYRGVEICKDAVKTKTMSSLGAKLVDDKPLSMCSQHQFDSKDYWSCVIRARPNTVYHPTSTCKMGSADDPTAVVDPQLRVRGIEGLRVADGSIMPYIVSANTHASIVMIGEKAADMIKGKQLPPTSTNGQPKVAIANIFIFSLTIQIPFLCTILF